MENDIIDALNDMGYEGPMTDRNKLMDAIKGGPKDIVFTKFISYLTNELRSLCNIDENVNPIKGPEDSISFLLELSSFLKELGCPIECLTQGHMSDRLSTDYDKLLLVEYLINELMASQMIKVNNPDKNMELKLQESSTASDLKLLLQALKFSKPPANITPSMLFQKVIPKLKEIIKRAGDDLVGRPLFNGTLNEKQWAELEKVQSDLDNDYTIRREMLLKRLDCTIQSFQWSDKVKGKEDEIVQVYHSKRRTLKVDTGINISDVLAARDDLAIIEKTSSAAVRKNTKSELNQLIIGQVPDRGGRPSEQAPPPPEMPSWQQRSGPSGAGARGGGRGGQRGGHDSYNRGGGNFNQQPSYDNNRGASYNDNYKGNNFQNQNQSNNYSGGNYNQTNFGGRGGGYGNRGGRSYESFQHNKGNYADQYVQDSQQNKQYSDRDNFDSPRGQRRGRSNYNRGGYR